MNRFEQRIADFLTLAAGWPPSAGDRAGLPGSSEHPARDTMPRIASSIQSSTVARAEQKYAEQSKPTTVPRPPWMLDASQLPRRPPPLPKLAGRYVRRSESNP